jgi:DNA mismatch repair protein MutL
MPEPPSIETSLARSEPVDHMQPGSDAESVTRRWRRRNRGEPFGGEAVRVRTLPALLSDLDPAEAVRTALGEFEEDETPLQGDVEARLAARVCKRAAIRAGQILSLAEQERLLRDLEACRSPRTCPHGRPTMIHISVDALERQFGRRG